MNRESVYIRDTQTTKQHIHTATKRPKNESKEKQREGWNGRMYIWGVCAMNMECWDVSFTHMLRQYVSYTALHTQSECRHHLRHMGPDKPPSHWCSAAEGPLSGLCGGSSQRWDASFTPVLRT